MCSSRVCVIHVFVYQHLRGVNGDASTSIGGRVADGADLGTHLRRPREALHLARIPRRCANRGTSCIMHAGGQLRLRVRGWWYRTQSAGRGTLSSGNDTAGGRHYPGPGRLYDQLGRAKYMIAPSIHKAPLACRSDGYGCYVRFHLRNPLLFLHHNLGRQLETESDLFSTSLLRQEHGAKLEYFS